MAGRKAFIISVAFLAVLHVAVFAAAFVAPYGMAEQDRDQAFSPPTTLHWIDGQKKWRLRPFVYGSIPTYLKAGSAQDDQRPIYPLRILVKTPPYQFAGVFTWHHRLFGVDAPGRIFLLGTDEFGRDLFSRMLYGGQISLTVGLAGAAISLAIGLLVGLVSGFYRGWLDAVLMRITEIFLALPWLYLLLAIRAFLPLSLPPATAFMMLMGVLGLASWARPARLIRDLALSAREREYVVAARGFGASSTYLIRRHIVPQSLGVALTQAALLIPQFILAEVTLSFLGLGIGEPAASWGNMMVSLRQVTTLLSHSWMLAPSLILVPVCYSYYCISEYFQQGLNRIS